MEPESDLVERHASLIMTNAWFRWAIFGVLEFTCKFTMLILLAISFENRFRMQWRKIEIDLS